LLRGDDVISDVTKNAVYRIEIREQKLESSLIKSLSENLEHSVLFGSGRQRSVQWRREVAISQHALNVEH